MIFLGLIALVGYSELTGLGAKSTLFQESGPVETLSAVGYFLGFMLLLFQLIRHRKPAGWSLCVVLLCFCARELDMHKQFTTMSIFKSRFYSSSEVPMGEKGIGLLVIIALIVCLFHVLRTYFLPFVKGLRQRKACEWSVLFALALLAVSKSLDGLERKLKPLGIVVDDACRNFSTVLEESLETAAPYLLIVAIMGPFSRPMPPAEPDSKN
jgi:hypothetical protein